MWKTVKLGDICDFQGGSQPPKKEFIYEGRDGYVRFIQIRDFKSDKNVTYIPTAKKNRLCKEDDILIGRYGASVGQILTGLEGAYNVALMKTIPSEEKITKGWLQAYLTSPLFQNPLLEVSKRSAQNGFSKEDISEFNVLLPPLAEQQRIVEKLDAVFAEIDRGIEAAEKMLSNAETMRTKFVCQTFQTLDAVASRLEDVTEILNGFAFKSRDFTTRAGIKVVKITNVGIREFIETDDTQLPIEFVKNYSKVSVKEGDVVFALTRTIINGGLKVARIPEAYHGALLNQRVAAVTASRDSIDTDFLYFYLSSEIVKDYVIEHVNTLMQPNLSIADLRNLEIPVATLKEQRLIAQRIEEFSSKCTEIQDTAKRKIREHISLKAAILAQELQPPQSKAA